MLISSFEEFFFLGLNFLLLLSQLHLKLSCFYAFTISRLRTLLFSETWILLILCIILWNLLDIRNLSQSTLCIGFTSLSNFSCSSFFIQLFFFEEILSSSRNLIFGMNLDEIFIQAKTWEGIEKIIAKFLIDVLFDFLLKNFELSFLLHFHYILNIPFWSECSFVVTSSPIYGFDYFFMLIIKGLNRTWNKIIRTDTFLHVLSVVDVSLFYIFVLLFVASWRQEESKDCFSLFELNWNWGLQGLNAKFFFIFFCCFELFFELILWFSFRFVRWHERFFLIHWATFFHLRIILT